MSGLRSTELTPWERTRAQTQPAYPVRRSAQVLNARPLTRPVHPPVRVQRSSVRVWAAVFTLPLVVVGGLLIWEPVWTLGTIAALIGLTVWRGARGRGSFVVETVTRTTVRR